MPATVVPLFIVACGIIVAGILTVLAVVLHLSDAAQSVGISP